MNMHERLRATAARLCSATTMERVIEPALTDIEIEYRKAIAQGRLWRSCWILIAGYFAFLKVIALYGYNRSVHDWSADDGHAFARTVTLSAAAFAVTVVILISPPAVQGVQSHLLPYLIPQTVPLAIPVGITLGIFCGLGGRVVGFRVKVATVALALACSASSLGTTIRIIPAASQAFRVSASEHLRLTLGKEATLTTGPLEMSINELRRTVGALAQSGRARDARNVAFVYYIRWALPCAPFVLTLFALSVVPRQPVRRWSLGAAAVGTCLMYYSCLLAADSAARHTALPIVASVWLPNVLFAVASAAAVVISDRPRPSAHA